MPVKKKNEQLICIASTPVKKKNMRTFPGTADVYATRQPNIQKKKKKRKKKRRRRRRGKRNRGKEKAGRAEQHTMWCENICF
jgi:hypothetical protein